MYKIYMTVTVYWSEQSDIITEKDKVLKGDIVSMMVGVNGLG